MTIDVTKIPKEKIVERHFTNSQGHEVIAKDLKLEVVPLREEKIIKQGDTWKMVKTHFVSLTQTKEEKAGKIKGVIIGDGIVFRNKETAPIEYPTEDINPNDIPFN